MGDLFDEYKIDFKKPSHGLKESVNSAYQSPKGLQALKNAGDIFGGGLLGLAQGGSDIGANIAQFPGDVYSYFTGKPSYQAPKPNLRSLGPQSEIGQHAEKIGEFAAPFLSPAAIGEVALGGALRGGMGTKLAHLIADALAGSAESENRKQGAALGALGPLLGAGARWKIKTPWTEYGATKHLNKAQELANEAGNLNLPVDIDFLRNLEYQMQSKHLSPSKMQLNTLIGEAAKGDYPSYRALQSALGDISRELRYPGGNQPGIIGSIKNFFSPQQTTASERLTGRQVEDLRQRYIQSVRDYLEKSGHGDISKLEKKGMEKYARYKQFLPKRNQAIAGGLAIAGIPGAKHLFNLFD